MKKETYTEEIFMDSGAWALCRHHVLKLGKKQKRLANSKHSNGERRELAPRLVRGEAGDFTYYDLTKGSPFRAYCDKYADFVKEHSEHLELWANIDVIGNPAMTWEVQRFFEEEHGLRLVPVVHHGASLKWVEKYIEHDYDVMGLGGFARKIGAKELVPWVDSVFRLICPESNGYKPTIRVHGFAVTAWSYMLRWPWYSVDSTSWVKYSAYGWICLPRWNEREGFQYNKSPLVINLSDRSPFKDPKKQFASMPLEINNDMIRYAGAGKHYMNCTAGEQECVRRWLKKVGANMEDAVKSHNVRSAANVHYFMDLQESLPPWPWPLDSKIVNVRRKTLGL